METEAAFKGFCLDKGAPEASVRSGRCAPFRQGTVPAFVSLVRKRQSEVWGKREGERERQKNQNDTKRGGLMERWRFCYVKATGEGWEKGYVFLHFH